MRNNAFAVKALTVAALCAACASPAQASGVTIYDTAVFHPTPSGAYQLDGFGRGDTSRPDVGTFSSDASSNASQVFSDTWNVDVDLLAPGNYQFTSTGVFATGSVLFTNVAFYSYDELGNRNAVLFDISEGGNEATGSGLFSVFKPCPVKSCVWINVFGTQDLTVGQTGYGSNLVAQIPEPHFYALLLAGLTAVAGFARRKRPAHDRNTLVSSKAVESRVKHLAFFFYCSS